MKIPVKKILTAFFISAVLFYTAGCSSAPKEQPETFDEIRIISIPEAAHNEIYTRVNIWIVDTFGSTNSVIQYADKEDGILKGSVQSGSYRTGIMLYKITSILTIEIKDEKCRISLTKPHYNYTGDVISGTYPSPRPDKEIKSGKIISIMKKDKNKLLNSFEEAVKTNPEDW